MLSGSSGVPDTTTSCENVTMKERTEPAPYSPLAASDSSETMRAVSVLTTSADVFESEPFAPGDGSVRLTVRCKLSSTAAPRFSSRGFG